MRKHIILWIGILLIISAILHLIYFFAGWEGVVAIAKYITLIVTFILSLAIGVYMIDEHKTIAAEWEASAKKKKETKLLEAAKPVDPLLQAARKEVDTIAPN